MLSPRQIHLDFHTSEHIPDVAADFDAALFARRMKEADVSSVTVFARCHHGWLYYDSKEFPQLVHPSLKRRSLLVEQVRALHAEGIRAPVYITVQWDYQSASHHPEWLVRKADGAHEGGSFLQPGFYQSLCVNTGYADFLQAQTREVLELLKDELDGVFFDIVGIRPCLCAACRGQMRETGVDMTDEMAVRRFARNSLARFKQRMTGLVRLYSKDCTIFYNAGHVGPCTREGADAYTHFELESLPSGGWGYLHFPITARYARKLDLPCMGMTGKFHTSWGDFHSYKNLAALEFEAFRMLSYGFACSIGDQLEPCGRLSTTTYQRVGQVYRLFKEREAWALPSVPLAEVALLTPENELFEHRIPESILGAAQMLEELAVQFDILDETMALQPYRVVILADDFIASGAFLSKLESYVRQGGRVIACHRGGMNAKGVFPEFFPADSLGDTPLYPDFIVAQGELAEGLEENAEYVMYRQGLRLALKADARMLLGARVPYFNRQGERFCSHMYTPCAKGEQFPAVAVNEGVLQFSHPVFSQYRDNAPQWVKLMMRNALAHWLPNPIVRHDGPSTLRVQALDQAEQGRYCAHVLSYIPVRNSATIDIVEERTPAYDVTLELNLPRGFASARLVPEDVALKVQGSRVHIPKIDGYAIVELK